MAEITEIKCHVRRGIFPNEWVVRIPIVAADGSLSEAESLAYGNSVAPDAVPSDSSSEVSGRLRAYLVSKAGGTASVVLPQPTFANGPSVRVPESELVDVKAG